MTWPKAIGICAVLCGCMTMTSAKQLSPEPGATRALFAARSLKCAFGTYASTDLKEDGLPKTGKQDFGFQIDAIDYQKTSARIIGNAGADDLVVLRGDSSVSFVERTPSGAVNLTTVFGWRDQAGRFKSVHSRHTAIAGPSPSQNYGYCQVW